jgi:hypothetical protein
LLREIFFFLKNKIQEKENDKEDRDPFVGFIGLRKFIAADWADITIILNFHGARRALLFLHLLRCTLCENLNKMKIGSGSSDPIRNVQS